MDQDLNLYQYKWLCFTTTTQLAQALLPFRGCRQVAQWRAGVLSRSGQSRYTFTRLSTGLRWRSNGHMRLGPAGGIEVPWHLGRHDTHYVTNLWWSMCNAVGLMTCCWYPVRKVTAPWTNQVEALYFKAAFDNISHGKGWNWLKPYEPINWKMQCHICHRIESCSRRGWQLLVKIAWFWLINLRRVAIVLIISSVGNSKYSSPDVYFQLG